MESCNENSIYWLRGDEFAYASAPAGTRLRNRLVKLAEQYPDDVTIIALNEDGSVHAKLPTSWFPLPIKPREVSEEERERRRELAMKNSFFNREGDEQ